MMNFLFFIIISITYETICYSTFEDKNIIYGVVYDNYCYGYFDIELDADLASQYCYTYFDDTANLIKIKDNLTNEFVADLLPSNKSAWIGLVTFDFSIWKWGFGIDWTIPEYPFWIQSKPSGFDSCAVIMPNQLPYVSYYNTTKNSGGWNSVPCFVPHPFFCRYEIIHPQCNDGQIDDIIDCYKHGQCEGGLEESCMCSDYYLENEIVIRCNNIRFNNSITRFVKNGYFSKCISDKCICNDQDYYGRFCNEMILKDAIFYKNLKYIDVVYVAPIRILPIGKFRCFNNTNICEFKIYHNYSSNLIIYTNENINIISPITDSEQFITLSIKVIESSSPSLIFNSLFVILPILLVVIILIIITLLICLIICIFKKKKKVDKIVEIDYLETKNNFDKIIINKDFFKINYDKLKIEKSIGSGAFCRVYLAKWNDIDVAFKAFTDNTLTNDGDFNQFERELTLLLSLSHPNIIKCYGGCLNVPRVGIILEYCSGGDLKCFVTKNMNTITFDNIKSFLKQISFGMIYLHERKIIHRDLKPENILMSKDNIPKISDFGISKLIEKNSTTFTNCKGTSLYVSNDFF